jgi:acetoacetate decarboxylase
MQIDTDKFNLQPLIGAADYFPEMDENFDIVGGTTDEYAFQFLTDRDAIQELLPEPWFTPGTEPIVTVLHSWFEGNSVVEGGDYAISGVFVSSRFDGEQDHVDGNYVLIMPENNNYCVHMGRDYSGTGKIFVDVPKPSVAADGSVRCECRVWDYVHDPARWQTMYKVDFGSLGEADEATKNKWQDAINSAPILTIKYIAGAMGGCDVNYAYKYAFERQFEQCWVGTSAEFSLSDDLGKSHVLERRVIESLKRLPVREALGTVHWRAKLLMKATQSAILR